MFYHRSTRTESDVENVRACLFPLSPQLKYWDGFITFPLCLVAQIAWCLRGLPTHTDGDGSATSNDEKFTELKEKK